MCGIAGYHGTGRIAPGRIDGCLARMRHRGPDYQDAVTVEHRGISTSFLHSRLSIIDLDPRARQPMADGPLTIVFNGELYNYREIRRELQLGGHRFRTESDTEVFLAAVRHEGWAVLDKFEGMWAFAVLDGRTAQLTLGRDRFAEKPLLMWKAPQGVTFGSEATFIGELAGRRFNPNISHLQRFLVNGYKSLYKTDETFFTELVEVPAGSLVHVSANGDVTTERYWHPWLDIDAAMTFDDAVAGTRDRLRRSIEIRLRADVPLAFSLSGGVDSVALTSIAKRELDADVHGFTIINTDPRYEETQIVNQVVAELGIEHSAIPLDTRGFLNRLDHIVGHRAAPVLTITHYMQWLLMEAVHSAGYRVVVGGTGADELFSGYYDHHLLYMASVDLDRREQATQEWSEFIRPHVRNPYLQDPARFVDDPLFRDHIFLGADRFASMLVHAWHEPFVEQHLHREVLRNRMLNELFHEAVPIIMHEEDLNAMHHSIENRSPYLDRALMEFAASIPTRHLIRDGRAKAVLRESVRSVAPGIVLDSARKVGFNAPLGDLVDFSDEDVRDRVLGDSPVFEVVRWDAIASLISTTQRANSESKFLFNFLSVKSFLEQFS